MGVLLFMTGDGVETGFFSKYLADQSRRGGGHRRLRDQLIYGLRGFGYPLLAYGFLVWVTAATPPQRPVGVAGIVWIFAILHLATAVAIRFLDPDPDFTAPTADDRGLPAGRH
ncbi:hypothetical protein AB0B07_35235 [Streptomyces sioyaensis]|uniref:hypothetical protein n=1 Tax=Streptomyces sioyaensis TaxID=67364 RepID=UPI0033D89B32